MKQDAPRSRLSIVLATATVLVACAGVQRPPAGPSGAAPALPAVTPAEHQALLARCAEAREKPSPRTAFPHEDLDAILWQQTAAEYQAATLGVYRAAQRALPGLVKAAKKAEPGKKPVVVLDLDETVLDNSRFQGRLLVEGRNYESRLWDCWVGQKQAGLVPGAEILFREMAERGVRARLVTNRRCDPRLENGEACPQKRETLENLNALLAGSGYVATPDEFLLSRDARPGTDDKWEDEKKPRRDFIARTHAIVMLVGDDLGDFLEGVRKSTIAARAQETARVRDRWGTSWFVLPNPSYGSWTAAVDEAGKASEKTRAGVVSAFPYPDR